MVRDPVQNLAVTLQRRAAGVPQTVGEKTQRALGGQFRIELPHGPRSGVAGVGELLCGRGPRSLSGIERTVLKFAVTSSPV